MLSRRQFLCSSVLPWLLAAAARAQTSETVPIAPTTRPRVGEIDHDRIVRAARAALDRPLSPDRNIDGDSFLAFTLDVPALAAACLVDAANAAHYRLKARALLWAWFVSPDSRLSAGPALASYKLLAARSALAEVAVALPFLALPAEDLGDGTAWFRHALDWLNSDRTALLARDVHDHNGSSWLLQTSAYASLLDDDAVLAEQRHRFKRSILREQVLPDGLFRNELGGPNPFRDSLYNLDLLAGSAQLLSTRFESLWKYELQDGPGMRTVIARHAALIAAPSTWPYPADATHFSDLPGRRPALLFAGRAYSDADYVALWKTLDPDPKAPTILRTFPIRQPLLWIMRRPAVIAAA